MLKRLVLAGIVFVCALALGAEETLYQIDLVPSGKLISRDLPTLKGTTYLFHQYPTGTLSSVRKSTVKQITKMSPAAAVAVDPKAKIVPIRDLAFQGPRSTGGAGARGYIGRAQSAAAAANAGTAARTTSAD
jgi:hypothetical protein